MTEAFFEAIKRGDESTVEAALSRDPQLVASRDCKGLSPVLVAAYHGHPHLAEKLAASPKRPLPLFDASAVGDLGSLAAALEGDIEIDIRNVDGLTALHLAAYFGQLDAARLLLEHGADPNAVAANESRVTPLHNAVAGGHRDVASLLLMHAAAPNAVQRGGFTPLHAAAQSGDESTAELLLVRGADPTLPADDGRTPADIAEASGSGALAEILRTAGEG